MLRSRMRSLTILIALAACGPAAAPPESGSRSPEPPPATEGAAKPSSLDAFCGGKTTPPCPTLAEHLAALRAKDCPNVEKSHNEFKLSTCGAFTRVDSDYGIVGYSRWFDARGVLVAGAAHVYEHRTENVYGTVPSCTPSRPSSVCGPPTPGEH